MKKSLLFSLITVVSLNAYEGCATTKENALEILSNSISVSVSNEMQIQSKSVQSDVNEEFVEEVLSSQKVSSSMTLSGVKYTTKDKEICATISQSQVMKSAKKALKDMQAFSINNLSDNIQMRAQEVSEALKKINFVQSVLGADKLARLSKKLKAQLNFSIVTFHSKASNARIKISGQKVAYSLSNNIILKPGTYSYTAINVGHEGEYISANGEFTLDVKKKKEVNIVFEKYPTVVFKSDYKGLKVTLNNKNYKVGSKTYTLKPGKYSYTVTSSDPHVCPHDGSFHLSIGENYQEELDVDSAATISFKSNKSRAKVQLNAKNVSFNKPYFLDCDKDHADWSIEYGDIQESGTYSYSAGDTEVITKNFLNEKERKKILERMESYSQRKEFSLNYGYAVSDKEDWNKENRLEFRYFQNHHTYKFGYGVNFGTPKDWKFKDINEVELMVSGRLQLVEALGNEPLHISTVGIVPYIGINTGFDISDVFDGDTYAIFRIETGSTFLITKDLGLSLNLAYDVADKEDFIATFGFVFAIDSLKTFF